MASIRLCLVIGLLLLAIGCRSTVSYEELQQELQSSQGTSFPGELIFEEASVEYLYYRIETGLGTWGRYRVPRLDMLPGSD